MYHIPLALQCIYGCSDEGGENGDGEEGREWRLLGILYADYLVLCGEPEEDLRVMVGCFVEMFRGKGLKVNAGKSNVMVFSGEEGLRFEVCVEQVSEFKYL